LTKIGKDIGIDASGFQCKEIRVWSTQGQTMILGARLFELPPLPPTWTGSQLAWPGRPVAVGVNGDFTDPWPPVLLD